MKQLNLNINSLVTKLTTLIDCGKNSVYKASDIAYRVSQSALQNQSLEAMYKLTSYLSADRVLKRLHKIGQNQIKLLIRDVNKNIKLPRKVELAIDFNEKDYYGDKSPIEIIGSKGGKYVRKYAELSCVNIPLFLNAKMIDQLSNNADEVVREFLDDFRQQYPEQSIANLFLDRGFFTKKVVKEISEREIPFIMPAVKNKAVKKLAKQFGEGKISSVIDYKFGDTIIKLAFLKEEEEVYVFATNTNHRPKKLAKLYRNRWQIETNFREQNKFSLHTRTKNFGLRFFVFVIAGLLFNAWQMTRQKLKHIKESYIYKYVLLEELLKQWQNKVKRVVVKKLDYFLLA